MPNAGARGTGEAVGGGSSAGSGGSSGAQHWVGTWTASPYPVDSSNRPPASLTNSVLRQVAHVSLGGAQIRVQFSNLSGNDAVTLDSAHIALCKAATPGDAPIANASARDEVESVTQPHIAIDKSSFDTRNAILYRYPKAAFVITSVLSGNPVH